MQPTEYPGQQREDETGVSEKGREKEKFSLSGTHVHLATRETSTARCMLCQHGRSTLPASCPEKHL